MPDKKFISAPRQFGTSPMFLLLLLFLGLKLTNVITWSWWWVMAPLWGPLAVIFIIMTVVFFGVLAASGVIALWSVVYNGLKN